MIKLTRVRTAPPVHNNFHGQGRVKINLALLKKKRDGKLETQSENKWNSAFWKESKTQLLAESVNKCAYCETPTRVVAYGDVEHFRPKSVYWWLAYSYENYLPSCTACNQEYKKDFFELADKTKQLKGIAIAPTMTNAQLAAIAPTLTVDPINDAAGLPLKDFLKELKKEKPLLINPYFDEPEKYLAYQPILETKEVVVVPAKSSYKKIVKACEDLFGINRKELMDHRFQWYTFYMTFRNTLADPGISANTRIDMQTRIADLITADSAYAGMIRYLETKPLAQLPWKVGISSF